MNIRQTYLGSASMALAAAALGASLAGAAPAFAVTVDELTANYQMATQAYELALDEQDENARDISAVKGEIKQANQKLERSKERLGDSAVAVYKHERSRSDLLNMVFESESVTDAIDHFESYARIQQYWASEVEGIKRERAELDDKKDKLEKRRERIAEKIKNSISAIGLAEKALRDADHSDGALYHQKQGNSSNCGATSFTVGVNILLHEKRFTDNVAVWEGPGFDGDSTQSLAFKGATWLMANGLSDQISCTSLAGDIHYADQLKAELEQCRVVIISAGPGSVWQRADGTQTDEKVFPYGHWIVFYHYEDGVFYANDSSVGAKKGAGCAYTTEQLQQWLDGRSNHFATVLSNKQLG